MKRRLLAGPATLDPAHFQKSTELDPQAIRNLILETRGPDAGFQRFGQALLDVLQIPPIDQVWKKAREKYGTRLHTYFAVEHELLRDLPWELLSDALQPLFPAAPCVRSHTLQLTIRKDPSPWPVRVFVIVAADPSDEGIQAEREVWNIRQALRCAEHSFDLEIFDVTAHPVFTLNALQAAMTQWWPRGPHILHFIGHSVADPAPMLKLYNKRVKQYFDWTLAQIGVFLSNLPDLRLVYLNACRSNVNSGEASAGSFSLGGCPRNHQSDFSASSCRTAPCRG